MWWNNGNTYQSCHHSAGLWHFVFPSVHQNLQGASVRRPSRSIARPRKSRAWAVRGQIGGAWRSQTCHQLELFWDTERTSYQFLEKRWHRITINHTSRVPQHTDTKFHAHKNIRIRSIVTMLGMLHTHTQVNECHAGWPYLSPGPEHLYLPCCSNCISTSTSSQVEERTWKRWQETHRLPAFPCSLRTPRPPISPDKSDFSK